LKLIFITLIATIITWGFTALGSATVLFFKNPKKNILNIMLGFSSGVMIAASFWSLLKPAIALVTKSTFIFVAISFVFGAVFVYICDKIISKTERYSFLKTKNGFNLFLLVFSITIHNIPEGLAVGVAFGTMKGNISIESLIPAINLAIGIAIQNFPEGAAVSIPLRTAGYSKLKSFMIGQASALVEPIFGVIGVALVIYSSKILPFCLAFAAGSMILVVVHELIPDSQSGNNRSYFSSFGFIIGFTVMMFLDVIL